MLFIELLFWFFLGIIFYNYIGYAIIIYPIVLLKNVFKTGNEEPEEYMPDVSLVIPAYNEEDFIEQKILNTKKLDYPKEKLEICFVTDGSTDKTPEIVKQHEGVTLFHEASRNGKTAAINRAMPLLKSPIVIFCDANTLLNPAVIKKIVRHYQDPKVGGVAGEKKVMASGSDKEASSGEGIYWKYESLLKSIDSSFYSTVGAAGELFSIRASLYEPVEEDTILDDFMISLRVNLKGYKVVYEPEAFARETPSASIKEERKRKVRISAGGFQSIMRLPELFYVFRHPKLSFLYFSHRVFRWTLSPLGLPIVLLANFLLAYQASGSIYSMLLVAQLSFYLFAFLGYVLSNIGIKVKVLYVPYYFVFMNLSLYQGFMRFLNNKQSAVWEKAKRS